MPDPGDLGHLLAPKARGVPPTGAAVEDLAGEIGVRYHDLYRTARRLGVEAQRHPTSRHLEITVAAAELLRAEYTRLRALHERSMKLAAAARSLNLAVSTVALMVKRGQLDIDPESDGSEARFVTRESVERSRDTGQGRRRVGRGPAKAVPLADVIRFTGRSLVELIDLVRAGVLEEVPGRGTCKLTASSLRAWLEATA